MFSQDRLTREVKQGNKKKNLKNKKIKERKTKKFSSSRQYKKRTNMRERMGPCYQPENDFFDGCKKFTCSRQYKWSKKKKKYIKKYNWVKSHA